ncbi:MAG TPA: hypothetical protein VGG85_14880 [Terracidiphilus sp.]|jgi:galactose mutarotase-like enzyme
MLEQSPTVFAKENVLIQNGECSITVHPLLGGKISSISIRGRELLQAPLAPLDVRTRTMTFDEADASGWDECLPSVAGACVTTPDRQVHSIPDHGDLWRVAWENLEEPQEKLRTDGLTADAKAVTLRAECFSLPLVLVRSLALSEKDRSWHLSLHYKLTNIGATHVPWAWSAHPLFAVEAGDRIVLPDSIHTLRLEGSGGGRLGTSGSPVNWPMATLADGGKSDLSVALKADSGVGDKLAAGPVHKDENWCVLERASVGIRIRVRFDAAATPYLGLWICYGGWPDRPGPKQTCVAIEPATAPVDSLAQIGPWSRTLGPGESSEWTMHVDFELM